MPFDPHSLVPLVYVLAGGVLTLAGEIARETLRRRRERRVLIGRLLADLIELRDRSRAAGIMITQLQLGPREQVAARQVFDVVIPGFEALAQRYEQTVTQLSGLSPILAVRLRMQANVPLALSRLRAVAVNDQAAIGAWAQIEAFLDRPREDRLDELTLEVARLCGWRTWRRVRAWLKDEPALPRELTDLLAKLQQQPKPPSNPTAPAR